MVYCLIKDNWRIFFLKQKTADTNILSSCHLKIVRISSLCIFYKKMSWHNLSFDFFVLFLNAISSCLRSKLNKNHVFNLSKQRVERQLKQDKSWVVILQCLFCNNLSYDSFKKATIKLCGKLTKKETMPQKWCLEGKWMFFLHKSVADIFRIWG